MNEILQQRIESAANHYLLHEHKSPLNDILHQCDLKTEMQYHRDIEQAYIEGGKNSLQNQWISVDEALPKDFKKVFFRAVGKNDSVCYGTGYVNIDDWYTDIQHIEQDYFKFKITHWMPIPSLKGDEG